jgi:hypothetical protein
MTYNTEAFLKYSSRPRWRSSLGAIALIYVWSTGVLSLISNKNFFMEILLVIFTFFMLVLVFEIVELDSTAKKINEEAGCLKDELDWLKSKYAALEKEQQESNSTEALDDR